MNIQVQEVSWAVDEQAILDRVMLDVEPGEFVGLIGPNGSGKSSLLRTVYRVLKPDAGLITLDETPVWAMDARQAAQQIAVVTQETTGDFDFSVYDVVLMGRNPHKGLFDRDTAADHTIVQDALRQVDLLTLAARSFQTLSGGEKQRALIARALAQQARFLVLDEPTNHLDIRYQLEILTLVKRLSVTTLAALHDLNLAAHFCDRLCMLDRGRVVALGTPEAVLQPERLAAVYQVNAHVERHPRSGQIQITYLPLEHRHEQTA